MIDFLARCAPTWLVQMPWLLSSDRLEGLQPAVLGATRHRMLREMVESVELLTTVGMTVPVVYFMVKQRRMSP